MKVNGVLHEMIAVYYFIEDQLHFAKYTIVTEHSNTNDYFDDFNAFEQVISKKYGESEQTTWWKSSTYQGQKEYWGLALESGDLEKHATWETETTKILLRLRGDNFKVEFEVRYSTKDPTLRVIPLVTHAIPNEDLVKASVDGNLSAVKDALQNGANINTKAVKGYTPLMLAIYQGHTDIATFLISSNADVNIKSDDRWTALMFAAFSGNIKLVDLLIQSKAEVNAKDGVIGRALIGAAFWGNTTVVKRLLEEGADANIVDKNGNTALKVAESQGHASIADMLRVTSGSSLETQELRVRSIVLQNEDDENIGKALVKRHVLIQGEFTRETVQQELLRLYHDARTVKGWKEHSTTTMIALFAYRTEAHYNSRSGKWSAMLSWNEGQNNPAIQFNESEFAALEESPQEKWEFTVEQRMKIYRELYAELWKAAGANSSQTEWDIMKPIANKYGLNEEQTDELMLEGMLGNWPE
jgi:ankyrin repeat protein